MGFLNILAVLGAFVLGLVTIIAIRSLLGAIRTNKAKSDADVLLESADQQKRRILLDAKEEIIQLRSSTEAEIKSRRSELQKISQRLANREENSDRRAVNLDRRERKLVSTEDDLEKSRVELKELRDSELTQLEQISALSSEEAKDIKFIGVSVLTSFSNDDLESLGFKNDIENQVLRLVKIASKVNLHGVVCSP